MGLLFVEKIGRSSPTMSCVSHLNLFYGTFSFYRLDQVQGCPVFHACTVVILSFIGHVITRLKLSSISSVFALVLDKRLGSWLSVLFVGHALQGR